jgi:hypothetical protein
MPKWLRISRPKSKPRPSACARPSPAEDRRIEIIIVKSLELAAEPTRLLNEAENLRLVQQRIAFSGCPVVKPDRQHSPTGQMLDTAMAATGAQMLVQVGDLLGQPGMMRLEDPRPRPTYPRDPPRSTGAAAAKPALRQNA